MIDDPIKILERAQVKPTSNRVLVLRALIEARNPISLIELEDQIETLERSSILRVLSLFLEHEIVHVIEDGKGITRYEICHGRESCSVDDMHVHFFCEQCNKVYCFEEINAPIVPIPQEFRIRTVNYMLKGICPDCNSKIEK